MYLNINPLEFCSSVRKSCRLDGTKITRRDYFKLHGSRGRVRPKITDRSIRYANRQLERGRGTKVVAEELNVTQRPIQRLWAEYCKTGTVHVQRLAGRPAALRVGDPDGADVHNHNHKPEGVVRTGKRLRKEGHDIICYRAYGIMKSGGGAGSRLYRKDQAAQVGPVRVHLL